MKQDLFEKIELIKEANSDYSNFVVNVFEAYQKNLNDLENKKKNSTINIIENNEKVIDLDKIWAKPYFYTKMRLRLENIINKIKSEDFETIKKAQQEFCEKIIFEKIDVNFNKEEELIDIVDYIQNLAKSKSDNLKYSFSAKEINEETLFKEEQLKMALDIINTENKEKQNEKVYDYVYNYLKQDFVSNNYCDFKEDKCISQRNHAEYSWNPKDGCCFRFFKDCKHLKNGTCQIECLPCRLFSCPFLSQMGIGYYANEIVLLKAFYSKKQRKQVVFKFFTPKNIILKKINKYNGTL